MIHRGTPLSKRTETADVSKIQGSNQSTLQEKGIQLLKLSTEYENTVE